MITKSELSAMIADLESQPHLSIKEEKCLEIFKARYDEMPCEHIFHKMTLFAVGGSYKVCKLCGHKDII